MCLIITTITFFQVTNDPVLVSVSRTTEIVMGLFLDLATRQICGFSTVAFWLKICGVAIVTGGVGCVTFSDKITEAIKSLRQKDAEPQKNAELAENQSSNSSEPQSYLSMT